MEEISSRIIPNRAILLAIKVLHTVVWAILAGATVGVPIFALLGHFDWVFALTVLILMEYGVLILNCRRCPLTSIAASFSSDRSDNFDIYLPRWLAHWNKTIFGVLFIAGELEHFSCTATRKTL